MRLQNLFHASRIEQIARIIEMLQVNVSEVWPEEIEKGKLTMINVFACVRIHCIVVYYVE